ncbi:uncharacterized protein LOC123547904 [Mercenaria mercenaria]|uniref:uncharacterized protein LOC123547904 n=1 Tax=Mercenaria mercenaria TaxID=6596 RepID=UPI00234F227C|nr:uncharacterized protein LOC123547904 [Mercenaria mercenaria]
MRYQIITYRLIAVYKAIIPFKFLAKVLLFDPENGDITNKFITALKTNVPVKYGLTLVHSSSPEKYMDIPLVLVVRCRTLRFEDDLDAAIAVTKEKTLKCPEIIIYFHMKDQYDWSETAKLAAEKNKYSQITIINMNFTREKLSYFTPFGILMKDVNRRAYDRLNERINSLARFEYKLFIYDAIATNQSETTFEELEKFMHRRLHVEKTKDPKDKVPLAVIYTLKKISVRYWKDLKDLKPQILFFFASVLDQMLRGKQPNLKRFI